jgi:hypothetical protein
MDNGILWKWTLRLIWVGSIVFFQALELRRYVSGESYRPFFGLYTAVLISLFLWFLASMVRNLGRRRNA